MEEKNPTLLISYSHDSKEHQDRVLNLSNKLRSEGIDCILDQYEDSPPEGWPKWMDRNVKNADFVLVICTETYYNRVIGNDKNGFGIKWESTLIYQHLYNLGANNTKFIPVLFEDGRQEHIPTPLQGATIYHVDDPTSYDKLYWRLRGIKTERPKLGKLRELPIKPRKTFFVSGLFDQEKWDKANWKAGVAFLYSENGELPPVFSVLFDNLITGMEIFEELIKKVGSDDLNERLRLSIVEGDVPRQGYGYFVTIGENIEATYKLLNKNIPSNEIKYVAIGQRINRMKPDKNSHSLSTFKKEYEKHHCYYIAPAKQINKPDGSFEYDIKLEYKILKRKIEFRLYNEIPSSNDPDSLLKSDEVINHKF